MKIYEDDEISRIMPGKKDFDSIARNIYKQKKFFLQTLRGCTLFTCQNILLCKLDFQSFAAHAQSSVFFLIHLEYILFLCAFITKTWN